MFRIIHLDLSEEAMRDRLEKRANFDDTEKSVNKRMEIWRTKTVPVLEKYCHKVVKVTTAFIITRRSKLVKMETFIDPN